MDTCKGIEGKTVVFTGRISKPRHEFQELVKEHGGIVGSDVSGNTDYLVVGEKPGSKLMRATMYGVKTISEQEFLNLLEPPEEEGIPATPEDQLEAAYGYRTKIIAVNGFLDHPHLITLECSWCGKSYQQWDDLPNHETCPMCEILYHPLCPHCGNKEPIFVTDYNSYYCIECQISFRAPYSIKAGWTEHIHIYPKDTEDTVMEDYRKCIFCGHKSSIFDEDPFKIHRGPTHFNLFQRRQWEREQREGRRFRDGEEKRGQEEEKNKQEKEALKFLNSLTSQELAQLEEQLNVQA